MLNQIDFTEQFGDLESAIGIMASDKAKKVGRERTKNGEIRSWGYTNVFYALDDFGEKWTVFYNPTTHAYSGAHLSSSQPC